MAIEEVMARYNIPAKILHEYRSWGLCNVVRDMFDNWEYDDRDLERLSMIMTLHDIGFSNEEVEKYMKLFIKGESTLEERRVMLNKQRTNMLDSIHLREKQLERLDYLRYEINRNDKT